MISKSNCEQFNGHQLEPTPWYRVTQEQINQFADCTLDHQSVHVDPESARATSFGSTIAHGFLTLSMLSHFLSVSKLTVENYRIGINYGFDKVRFVTPVKVDSNIRALFKILKIDNDAPDRLRFKTEVTIEIEGSDRPALIADWLTLVIVT